MDRFDSERDQMFDIFNTCSVVSYMPYILLESYVLISFTVSSYGDGTLQCNECVAL